MDHHHRTSKDQNQSLSQTFHLLHKIHKNPMNMQTSSSSSSSNPNSASHSSITLHSLVASSTDSSSSSFFQSSFPSSSSSSSTPSRCVGLNLLVKAIHQVTAGSVVGVPYIQRRILTRRKRPLQFHNLILTTALLPRSESKSKLKLKSKPKAKRQRRVNMAMPSKYRDSVLQPLRSSSDNIISE